MAPSYSRHLKSSDALQVDRHIWKACAGSSTVVQPPPVRSVVYYFPQGHAEHADRFPVTFSPRVYSKLFVRCRVVSVEYLARADTDEVFSKIRLTPIGPYDDDEDDGDQMEVDEEDESARWLGKVLTSSDANCGGGFTMPKPCADIFPKLNFKANPPSQQLSMNDLQGKIWKFRHIYGGKPVRNLLTTGWCKFVNSKKLIHGDSVVFISDTRNQKLFITVHRAISKSDDCNATWMTNLPSEPVGEVMDFGSGFSRSALGKVAKEDVIEAAELAAAGEEFEVTYYPGGGFSNFLVSAKLVDRMLAFPWSLNVKVKTEDKQPARKGLVKGNVETEDKPARKGMVQGTVVGLSGCDESGLCDVKSPWRMLKIHWEDPRVAKEDEWVSPWEVEIDNLPWAIQMVPESVFGSTAPPAIFNLNESENTLNARIGLVVRDDEPDTNVPSSVIISVDDEATNAAEDDTGAQNQNMNPVHVRRVNNAHHNGSFKLFGKIISYNDVSA